jgi:hypothetical protein
VRFIELYKYDMRAIEAEIEDIVVMTDNEASSNDDTRSITIISHNPPRTTPSIVLHGAENEHPTMDFNTFKSAGEEMDSSLALRIIVYPPKYLKKKHVGREKCVKCREAAWASMHVGSCMKRLMTDLRRTERGHGRKMSVAERLIDEENGGDAKDNELETLMFDLGLEQIEKACDTSSS